MKGQIIHTSNRYGGATYDRTIRIDDCKSIFRATDENNLCR